MESQVQEVVTVLLQVVEKGDPDLKKSALEGLTSIARTNWTLLVGNLEEIYKFAFAELPIRKELIDEIVFDDKMSQKVDRGTPIRRAAYMLLFTLF
jgi:hypothetical protein